ncbi:hypothetical protein GOP47_0018150 [Adiantum capillus-veneris]|uniref:Uncharacterized protein n=1 Tax=Adiantum capillus-veneris TaxID=13818 RepID=A0A9D4UH83_ADICA|nr:hypothetical protein GOP47_0018150 [Adiantum capillus-veneris]
MKVLPPPLQPQKITPHCPLPLSLAIDSWDPWRFYVFRTEMLVPGNSLDKWYFEVFDSKTGRWIEVAKTTVRSKSGLLSGDFFFIEDGDPQKVVAYHAAQNAWSMMQVPWKSSIYDDPCLKYGGRLFRARFEHVEGEHRAAFVVWELRFSVLSESAPTWVQVSRTPDHLKAQLALMQPIGALLHTEGPLFLTRMWNDVGFLSPLVYDVSNNSWYLQVLPLEGWDCEFLFVHRPRLSMSLP